MYVRGPCSRLTGMSGIYGKFHMPMSKATNSSTSSKVSMLLTSCALSEGVVLFSIRIGYLHTSMPEQGQVSRVL